MSEQEYNSNSLDHTCGVSDDELSLHFKEAVRIENEIKKLKGLHWENSFWNKVAIENLTKIDFKK